MRLDVMQSLKTGVALVLVTGLSAATIAACDNKRDDDVPAETATYPSAVPTTAGVESDPLAQATGQPTGQGAGQGTGMPGQPGRTGPTGLPGQTGTPGQVPRSVTPGMTTGTTGTTAGTANQTTRPGVRNPQQPQTSQQPGQIIRPDQRGRR